MNSIKFIIFDFDGVFSDCKFYFDNEKNIKKCYNGKDSYALKIIKNHNIKCGIITKDKVVSIENAPHIFSRLDKVSLGSDEPKLNILNKWIKEYELIYDEVAYIGDDLPDIEILKKVGFSACPNDAIDDVKSICNYISNKKGGDGAVRDIVNKIIEINKSINKSINNICFCIPARFNSTRLNKKLLLPLDDKSCIQHTISQIYKSKYFNNNIIIFTDSEMIKENIINYNCNVILTDGEYKNGSERISKNLNKIDEKYNIIVNIQADEPFISYINIDFCIDKHIENIKKDVFYTTLHETNNSEEYLKSTASLKVIVNKNNDVLYYSRNIIPSNKNGKINKNIKYNTFTGIYVYNKLSLLQFSKLDNTFLQNEEDCEQLKILENGFKIKSYKTKVYNEISLNTEEDYKFLINKYKKSNKKSYILDCTLRDGGYINNWRFNDEFIKNFITIMNKINIDFVEIGFVNKNQLYNKKPTGIMRNINEEYLDLYSNSKFKISVLCDYKNINMKLLKKKLNIDLVRVAFHKNDMDNAIKICKEIQDLGYKVSINAMAITNYSKDELNNLINIVNKHNFFLLYLADSYGGLNNDDINSYLTMFNQKLENTAIGIHLHNNMNNAFSNFECALKLDFNKDLYIDCTLFGMGRGAGNLQTELVINNKKNDLNIDTNIILELLFFIENYIKKLYSNNINSWGYDLDFFISGLFNLHPNYIVKMREFNISFNNLIFLIKLILENKKEAYFDLDYINEIIREYNNKLL